MTKFITILIGASLALATGAQAKQAEEQANPKNKKSKPVQQQQVAPKQTKAPKPQVQAMPRQSKNPTPDRTRVVESKAPKQHKAPALQDNAKVPHTKGTQQNLTSLPPVQPNKHRVQDDSPVSESSRPRQETAKKQKLSVPAVQSNKFKANKTVKNFQPKHQNFHARVNPSVASVQFNQNFRIRNAENWRGDHYNVFRTYRPQWHDRSWWSSNHSHIVLIGGGWYYWNSGYWYPAWGYDDSAAYYPYDGPIYVGDSPRPFDQVVADVQSILQEQGYYRGEVDGLVGPLTQEALAAYQSAQGLEPTAAIDQPTLESLGIS